MIRKISREELYNRIIEGEIRADHLVNVLSAESYRKEHIAGSISIPVKDLDQQAPRKFRRKDDKIVVYCASFDCNASTQAAEFLSRLGYTNIYEYEGGMADWKEGELPTESISSAA